MRKTAGILFAILLLTGLPAFAPAAAKHTIKNADASEESHPASIRGVPVIYRDPYLGMIAIDGATGKVLAENNADATVYPASVTKLMTLFVVEDRLKQGTIHLNDSVEVNAEMSHTGGTRVFLKEHEVFTVEELLYALMMQSANDCALALAVHVAGSQPAFVELMNQKAQALGLAHTRFFSCHGLPPTPPRKPADVDVSSARDLAMLGRALVESHPEVLQYTSCIKRTFRPGPHQIDMLNHNHRLMTSCPGVDGLKTGYFDAAGYSSVVTAQRNGRRVFVVVAGSGKKTKDLGKARDKASAEALSRAFASLPPLPPPPPPVVSNAVPTNIAVMTPPLDPTTFTPEPVKKGSSNLRTLALVLGVVVLSALGVAAFFAWRRHQGDGMIMDDDLNRPRRGPLPPLQK